MLCFTSDGAKLKLMNGLDVFSSVGILFRERGSKMFILSFDYKMMIVCFPWFSILQLMILVGPRPALARSGPRFEPRST